MSRTPQTWQDDNPAYPVSAARMVNLEDYLVALDARLETEVLLADKIRRGDSDAPGTADSGQTWAELTGDVDVAAGELVTIGTSQAVVDVGSSEVDHRARIRHQGGAPSLVIRSGVLAAGAVAGNDRIVLTLDAAAGSVLLQKVDTGAGSVLGTPRPYTFDTGGTKLYRTRVVAIGPDLYGFVDGRLEVSYSLSTAEQTKYAALTRVGIRATSTPAAFRDVVCGARPAAPDDHSMLKEVTGAYTLTAADVGKTLVQLSATASTLTVPANVIPRGGAVYLVQQGVGAWTVTQDTGMVVRGAGPMPGQYKAAALLGYTATEAWLT